MHDPVATEEQENNENGHTLAKLGDKERSATAEEEAPRITELAAEIESGTEDNTKPSVDNAEAKGDDESMDSGTEDEKDVVDNDSGGESANGNEGESKESNDSSSSVAHKEDAMDVDTDDGDGGNQSDDNHDPKEKESATENEDVTKETKVENGANEYKKETGKTVGTNAAKTTNGSGSTATPAPSSAPVPAAPPPPVLKGTLSFNKELQRHVIRGMWNYENSNDLPPQRFELIRNLNNDEDPTELPKDGEFHGSFSLAYFHMTSKGKRKERSKVIPESGVKITFQKIEGKDKEFVVDGEGTNQFGIFNINGTATPSLHAGDPTFNIELRKRYKPTPASAQPAPPIGAVATAATVPTTDAVKKSKKIKKRKHDDDDDGADQAEQDPNLLPPPSSNHPTKVIALRGKLTREQSEDLGVTEVIHKISGLWGGGLDLLVADPQNIKGQCSRFEYEHKMSVANETFPLSGRYTGWFDLNQENGSRARIAERDVTLKFRKNNAGYYNVEGRGSNNFGKYKITGNFDSDNILTIYKHFSPIKPKRDSISRKIVSVTAAPPPLQGAGGGSGGGKQLAAQAPPQPQLKLDEVVLPDPENPDEPIKPLEPPEHGTYSVISRGVLKLNDDGAVTCGGKWAMTREHYNNGTTSSFQFRLDAHHAAEAVVAMKRAKGSDEDGTEKQSDASATTATFPIDSALYRGSFQMKRGAKSTSSVIDQQIVLKFRLNSAGSYNVHGKGINTIGTFTLLGTVILSSPTSGHVELYRLYPPAPPKAAPTTTKALAPAGKGPATSRPGTFSKNKDGGAAAADSAKRATDKTPLVSSVSNFDGPSRPELNRRESSRLGKPPSRFEDDDPQAQMARVMEKCALILKFISERDTAAGAFFRDPVDPVAHGIPTYYQIISEPIDIGTIQRKMDANEISSPEDFARQVRLIFENAMKFNVEPAHVVHQAGRNLLILFNQKFRDVERLVENIRRTHKPTEAELREAEREQKRKEKEDAKKAKRKAKDDKKRKRSSEDSMTFKKSRLEEAKSIAAVHASGMSAIIAAVPSSATSGGTVTRAEFNMLLQMIQQLQGQVVQCHTLLASVPAQQAEPDEAVSVGGTSEADQGFSAPPNMISAAPHAEKKRFGKKKEVIKQEPVFFDDESPLTLKEQEVLTETINKLPPERLPGVIQIIRESASLNGDEDEIDLEIDQLDTMTQRKLQRYVLKYVKPPRKSKAKSARRSRAAANSRPAVQAKKEIKEAVAPSKKAAQPKAAPDSFFAFGSKGDSDSDSDSDSDVGTALESQGRKSAGAAPKEEFNLGEGFGNDDDDDDDDDLGDGGIAASWNMSQPVAQSANKDVGYDGAKDEWGAAREKAVVSNARQVERKALEDKIIADAETAKNQRLVDAAARGDEIRAQRIEDEANEARLREQQEKDAEEARKAARDAARAQVQAVEQTVDLDAQRDIMKQYEQNFLDKESGSASPSSDFGF